MHALLDPYKPPDHRSPASSSLALHLATPPYLGQPTHTLDRRRSARRIGAMGPEKVIEVTADALAPTNLPARRGRRSPDPRSATPQTAKRPPLPTRSLSRRRYKLPEPAVDDCCTCCCTEAEMSEDVMVGETGLGGRLAQRRASDAAPSRRSSTDSEPGTDDATSGTTSSSDSFSPLSLAPSSMSTVKTKLFDSDDEDDDEDIMTGSGVSFFTPATPASLTTSPLSRKSSVSKTAKSDPLLAPSTSPILSFKVSPQGQWIPAPAAPVTECVSSELDLPDVVKPAPASATPPSSPPRASTSPPSSRPSLLTKSLRSLSRLPNLTLPRFPSPDAYLSISSIPAALLPSAAADLATLPPGWGPAERRRVLAAEPSHAADEARGFSLSLRRRKEPFLRAPPPSPVDEVEAAGMMWDVGELDLREKDKRKRAKVAVEDAPPAQTASPTDDIAPLPPSSTAPTAVPAATAPPVDDSASAAPAPSPQPVPRFISNHRHLLMLSLEFEMMRHAKIRGPLRQRAVIVRPASPPRKDGQGVAQAVAGSSPLREGSKLRQEVCV